MTHINRSLRAVYYEEVDTTRRFVGTKVIPQDIIVLALLSITVLFLNVLCQETVGAHRKLKLGHITVL